MVLRRLAQGITGRRLTLAGRAVRALRAGDGRGWARATRLLAVAAVSYRWRAAGMAFELGRRLWRWRR